MKLFAFSATLDGDTYLSTVEAETEREADRRARSRASAYFGTLPRIMKETDFGGFALMDLGPAVACFTQPQEN